MPAQMQAWLTVAGLSLDFLGFCLLLREWWIAFYSDAANMLAEEALERQQKFRAFSAQNANDAMRAHLSRAGEMQDDMALRRMRDAWRAAQSGRRKWFIASGVFVVLGFVFQLLGALPL